MLYTHAELDTLTFPAGITTVGVELEGFWECPGLCGNTRPEDCDDCTWSDEYEEWHRCSSCEDEVYDGYTLRRSRRELDLIPDGSVCTPEHLSGSHISGESVSEILRDWSEVMDFVLAHYPDEVDESCGLHVHMGCTRDQWSFAFDPLYWNLLRTSLMQIGQGCSPQTRAWLNQRLAEGRSADRCEVYCAPNQRGTYLDHYGDRQPRRTHGRYWAVNYEAFDSHGTLEVRVNPMAEGRGAVTPERVLPTPTRFGHPYRPAIQALNLIYTTLTSTGTFWTDPDLWREETARAVVADDLTLQSALTPAVHEHVRVTI